ncbi:carbohydrate binding domain-containing protein [Butyrivibrio sp. FCS014]|uniref:carbohydrate binding domain-containing protein n=1 Tax=Butyrivibrio sp. FCS014 TaxID=1408304 RepID=UPI0004662E17|nr:carbohydrate binding domain-containing protein [Butyrivibrio sp. FCS014]
MRKVYFRKTVVGLLAAALAVTTLSGNAFAGSTSVAAEDDGYSLVWEDNFDGNSLNTSDWNVETHEPGWVNNELQRYTSLDEGNIEVKDGSLYIKPHYEAGSEEAVSEQAQDTYISFEFTVWDEVTEDIALQINMGKISGIADAPTPTNVVIKDASLKEVLAVTEDSSKAAEVKKTALLAEEKVAAEDETEDEEDAKAAESDTADETNEEESSDTAVTGSVVEDKADDTSDAAAEDETAKTDEAEETEETEETADPAVSTETVVVTPEFTGAEGDDGALTGSIEEHLSDEMLTNPGFNGGDGWYCGFNAPGEGTCSFDGEANITINNCGNENWHVQLNQNGIKLEQGHTYRFSMTASSNVDKYVEINFMSVPSYKWYGGGGQSLIKGSQASGGAGQSEITSGRITTQNKHDFTYGRFEARAKVPAGKGYLPAFWLMATDEGLYGQWPKCGEIDIMEVMGQDTGKSYHTIHYGYSADTGHKENQGSKVLGGNSFSDEYHVFTIDWDPGKITWYVDGEEVYSTDDWYTGTDDDNQITYPAPFDQNFYIILNLAVGGSWVGYPGEAEYAQMNDKAYEIDYVKVYQKSAEEYARLEKEAKKPEKSEVKFREADATGNFVVNGDFAEDISFDGAAGADPDNWKLHLESDAAGTTYEVKDNAITITPSVVGGQNHSVQLKQENIPMYKGWEYELTFDAVSTEDRNIVIDVEGPDRGWTRYMQDTTVAVGTQKQSFTYSFTMEKKTDANGSLEFNLGNRGTTAPVTISNVRLTHKSGDEISEDKSKTIRPDGNYIYNGSFDQGDRRLGYWEFSDEDAENISVTNSGNVRELKVEVPEGKTVTLKQTQLSPLGNGTYEVSFDARTEDGAADGVRLDVAGTEYTPSLKGENGKYAKKISVENSKTREESYIEILFVKPGTYYIDNVFLGEAALIKNGSFNAGLTGFAPYLNDGAKATYVVDNMNGNDNTFAITIDDTGDTDWYVQLNQDGVTLEEGKTYFFSLRMRSDIERKVSYMLQQFEGNWSCYSGTGVVEIGPQWQTFENTFTMNYPTDIASRFNVTMGAVAGERISEKHNVYVDDIILYEVKGEAEGGEVKPNPEPGTDTPEPAVPKPGTSGNGAGGSGSGGNGGNGGANNGGSSAASAPVNQANTSTAAAGTALASANTAAPQVLGEARTPVKSSGKSTVTGSNANANASSDNAATGNAAAGDAVAGDAVTGDNAAASTETEAVTTEEATKTEESVVLNDEKPAAEETPAKSADISEEETPLAAAPAEQGSNTLLIVILAAIAAAIAAGGFAYIRVFRKK